jgi:glutamyl/glutaminyl-tRNA synthetase
MIRTRFAPSPTGSLHVGGVRTALYCLLFARQQGGKFVLRIEDTDQARSTDEAARGIQRDLRWCGLLWDEGPDTSGESGPYFQSQRLSLYNSYVDRLLASGHAYEAWESKDELAAMRQASEAKKTAFRYRRVPYTDADVARFRAEGRVPVIRLEAPKHDVVVHDEILGDVTVVESELEDIVIRKTDGFPTYHFAVVIDDQHMLITDVLRGQEHLMNTPKHAGLYEALGWEMPRVGHLPLIFNPEGTGKMSKRDKANKARKAAQAEMARRKTKDVAWLAELTGLDAEELRGFVAKEHDRLLTAEIVAKALDVDLPLIEVMDYRKAGYLPEALVNYLALLGWSPGDDREILSFDEMVAEFAVGRVKKTAARFDPDKLQWMNSEYIRRSSIPRLMDVLASYLEVTPGWLSALSPDRQAALLRMYQERTTTLAEMDRAAWFFASRPTTWDGAAVQKHVLKVDGGARLREVRQELHDLADFTAPAIDAALKALSERTGEGIGRYAQPLRVAISGGPVSPPIGDTLAFLGKAEVIERIDVFLDELARNG